METLLSKISEKHNSSLFYEGVIAYGTRKSDGKVYVLTTEQIAEIEIEGDNYSGAQISNLGLNFQLTDKDINDKDVLVDNWIVISAVNGTDIQDILYDQDQYEDRIFDNYDDAMKGFIYFLEN